MILHAGDVGGSEILEELQLIAPTKAVFGNTDDPGDPSLVRQIEIEVGGVSIHMSHGHELGSPTPDKLAAQYDADVVIYGHTHQQLVTRLHDRLFVNPGSAGARRFNLLPSVARLTIAKGKAEVEIIDLS